MKEAFTYKKLKYLTRHSQGKSEYFFTETKPPKTKNLTVEQVIEHINMCIDYSLIQPIGSKKCYRQTKGIPMGGNASPLIANLYCYQCESKYIDTLTPPKAKIYSTMVRYIDDFLCWGHEPPPPSIYKMDYKDTTISEDHVVFLGARIRIETKEKRKFIRLSISRKDWSFRPLQYVHSNSTMPVSIPKGVVKGAMFRAAMICNNLPDLFVEFEFILYRMWKRGFKKQDVAFAFREFCDEFYKAYDSTYKRLFSLVHVVFGKLNNPHSYHFPKERQFIVYPPKAVVLIPEEPIVQEGKVDYFTIDHTIWYMEEVGLYPEDVNRFGNCFFEAVSKQIFYFFDAATLREFTSAELVEYSDKYKNFVLGNYDEYALGMGFDGVWADHAAIQALSNVLGVSFFFLSMDPYEQKDSAYFVAPDARSTFLLVRGFIILGHHANVPSEHFFPILGPYDWSVINDWCIEYTEVILNGLFNLVTCSGFTDVESENLPDEAGVLFDKLREGGLEIILPLFVLNEKDITSRFLSKSIVNETDSKSCKVLSPMKVHTELEQKGVTTTCPQGHDLEIVLINKPVFCDLCDSNYFFGQILECRLPCKGESLTCDWNVCLNCVGIYFCCGCGMRTTKAGTWFAGSRGLQIHQLTCEPFLLLSQTNHN